MPPAARLIALEYHDVVGSGDFDASGFPGAAAASYKLTAETFERHATALAALRQRVLPAAAVVSPMAFDEGGIILTFDDGGTSAISHTAPILEARGMRGTFFITTDRIDTPGFLTSAEIAELHARGHTIGSHSCSHPVRMAAIAPAAIVREWRESVARLAAMIDEDVTTASVPGGYYSRAVGLAAAAAGVRVLFTSEPTARVTRAGECTVVGRFTLRREDAPEYVTALVGAASSARRAQWVKWNAKKVVKALGGRAYLRLRERVFRDS
jgi:peptidoglycan/xylan/chitin deacetylase (PgdA/CDA1 family)